MQEQWLELEFKTSQEASEVLAELLIEEGAAGVATEDPNDVLQLIDDPNTLIFTDPSFREDLPDFVRVRAYFIEAKTEAERAELVSKLTARFLAVGEFLDLGPAEVSSKWVADSDWANNWKQHYHPQALSERVVVCPSWETYEAQAGEVVMTLDPASAFGTGEHATTALCVQRLDELEREGKLKGRILDLGCGSGILAIAMGLLGAERIEAADLDPQACRIARENVELNNLEKQIEVSEGVLTHYVPEIVSGQKAPFDLVVANILAEVHLDLIPEYLQVLPAGGRLLLSGIIDTKTERLEKALSEAGFKLLEKRQREDWILLELER